jgi:proteasome lid subunit RPN8/RPN11
VSDGLTIPPTMAESLLSHARSELPNEACGLLSGQDAGHATAFHPARNAEASPYAYEVHPEDLVRIVLGIEDAGEELVAVFHSHPRSPAVPSVNDLRNATYPVVYLLASLADEHALRAWRIEAGVAREVPLRVG